MTKVSAQISKNYNGLRRRGTYEEQVQYIKRQNGEFLIKAPDRTSTTIEMMSPYLSAWKAIQQAIITKKQAELAYWTDGSNGVGDGNAPLIMQPGPGNGDDAFQSMPSTVNQMIDGRLDAVSEYRAQQRDRLNMHLERAAQNVHDRQQSHQQFFIGSDPDLELAQHEGLDLEPLETPQAAPPSTTESLREAAINGGRLGALTGAAARGAQLAGSFGRGALGSLARDAFAGELEFTTLGGIMGEGAAAAGLTGGVLGPALVPVLGAAAGTILAGAAIGTMTGIGTGVAGNLENRLMTGVHWIGDHLGHVAHNAGALDAHERGIDARPAPMALDWDRAVGIDHRAQPRLESGSYEHARQFASAGSLAAAAAVPVPSTIGSLSSGTTVSIPRSSRSSIHDLPLPNFPGGMNGPRPLTNVERSVLNREASANLRYARPPHGHGIGRG